MSNKRAMTNQQADLGDTELDELISQLRQEPAFYLESADGLRFRLERSLSYIDSARAFYKENKAHLAPSYSASAPVLRELRSVCPMVGDIRSALQCSEPEYFLVVPILIKWLPQVEEPMTKNSIISALSSRHAREVAPLLIQEFRRESSSKHALRHTISRALEAMADDSLYPELVDLARDRAYGRSRKGIVLGLSKMRDPAVVDVLIDLLDDPTVTLEVVHALERRVDPRSRSALEPYTVHPNIFVQRHAHRAITKIEAKEAKQRRNAQAAKEGNL